MEQPFKYANVFTLPTVKVVPCPMLGPDDIRGLISLLGDLIRNSPMNEAQRAGMTGTRDRLQGLASGLAPSQSRTFAAWLKAMLAGEREGIVTAGNDVLAAVMANGDAEGCRALLAALSEATDKLLSGLAPQGPGATAHGGPLGSEAGSAKGIEWHEPDAELFYVSDGEHGEAVEEMILMLGEQEAFRKRGAEPPNRAAFLGDPGNGKTLTARYIAKALRKKCAVFLLSKMLSTYVSGAAQNIMASMDVAAREGAVIVWDELEAMAADRSAPNANSSNRESENTTSAVNQILDWVDRMAKEDPNGPIANAVIIACTNVLPKVDPAVARRFRTHLTFPPPSTVARAAMLAHYWKPAMVEDAARELAIARTAGKSGSAVEDMAHDANRIAGFRALKAGLDVAEEPITVADVEKALKRARTERSMSHGGEAETVSAGGILRPTLKDTMALTRG